MRVLSFNVTDSGECLLVVPDLGPVFCVSYCKFVDCLSRLYCCYFNIGCPLVCNGIFIRLHLFGECFFGCFKILKVVSLFSSLEYGCALLVRLLKLSTGVVDDLKLLGLRQGGDLKQLSLVLPFTDKHRTVLCCQNLLLIRSMGSVCLQVDGVLLLNLLYLIVEWDELGSAFASFALASVISHAAFTEKIVHNLSTTLCLLLHVVIPSILSCLGKCLVSGLCVCELFLACC